MYTVINGFDRTDVIPFDSIDLSGSINDPQPSGKLDIDDIASQLSFAVGQEIIIFDEAAPPTYTVGGQLVQTIPAHNLLRKAVMTTDTTVWSATGALSSLVTEPAANQVQLTFNNSVLGQGLLQQTTLPGYVHAGQSYMLSAYVTISQALINAQGLVQMDFLDASGNVLSPVSLEADTFVRSALSSGWGTASDGHTWLLNQSGGTLSTNGTQGQLASSGGGRMHSTLGATTYTDMEVVARFTPGNTGDDFGCDARLSGSSSAGGVTGYRCNIHSGALQIVQIVNGSLPQQWAGPTKTITAGTAYWMRFRVSGTNPTLLQGRMWQDGTSEPSAWDIEVFDIAPVLSGAPGLTGIAASATAIAYDHFTVTNVQQLLLSSTPSSTQTRMRVWGVAPTNASTIRASFGGQTTVASSNSGTVNLATFQLEPMWFSARGVSYPTPDCNYNQVSCARLPDDTISRACRIFAGYIDDWQVEYDGPNRTWHLSLAGPGALLENGLINAIYSSQYDDQIIPSVINAYFANQISLLAPNSSAAAPVQRGALIDSVNYSDNTLREVLNGLVDDSGYMYYIDWYYTLRYNPSFYAAVTFSFTDATPDNISTFNYYGFSLESDGTQRKRRIKIVGGKMLATAQDVFNGNGSTTTFNLTYIPHQMNSLTVGGTQQRVGIKGRDVLSSGKFDVLLDKANQQLIFNTTPASGSGNVVGIYSFEATLTTQVLDQDATNTPVAPAYALPNYDAKVHDSNLLSLNAATQRGLAELSKFSKPKSILKLSANVYAPVGYIVFVTHQLSGIINVPFVVQTIENKYLGNGINEYVYQLGAYQPSLLDHIRNANKASVRSATVANVNAIQQIDVVASELIQYSDSIRATTATNYATGVYGTAKYGQVAYGGITGAYGTAQYGTSYVYG